LARGRTPWDRQAGGLEFRALGVFRAITDEARRTEKQLFPGASACVLCTRCMHVAVDRTGGRLALEGEPDVPLTSALTLSP
jgi:hypothetical protein